MLHFRTEGYNGCAVKYSPFFDNRLAVAASANFGLVGNGRLFILELTPNGIVPAKWYVSLSTIHSRNSTLTR
jgi:peroxin-7